jgi:hypothetical protein
MSVGLRRVADNQRGLADLQVPFPDGSHAPGSRWRGAKRSGERAKSRTIPLDQQFDLRLDGSGEILE